MDGMDGMDAMDAFDRATEREAKGRRDRRSRPVWKRFLIHLRIYIVVNAALIAVWALTAALTTRDTPWFRGSLIGWGIGVLVHYVVVTQITGQWGPVRTRPPVVGKGVDR